MSFGSLSPPTRTAGLASSPSLSRPSSHLRRDGGTDTDALIIHLSRYYQRPFPRELSTPAHSSVRIRKKRLGLPPTTRITTTKQQQQRSATTTTDVGNTTHTRPCGRCCSDVCCPSFAGSRPLRYVSVLQPVTSPRGGEGCVGAVMENTGRRGAR